MEYLYVCLFSNGHIKVGRSVEPGSRIAAHAERVSCLGIELVSHHIAACIGSATGREAVLIQRCVDAAESRSKNEWFAGLDYTAVCGWASETAVQTQDAVTGYWIDVVRALQSFGLSQKQIADACGLSQPSISEIKTGVTKDPRFSVGTALLALLEEHTAKASQGA